ERRGRPGRAGHRGLGARGDARGQDVTPVLGRPVRRTLPGGRGPSGFGATAAQRREALVVGAPGRVEWVEWRFAATNHEPENPIPARTVSIGGVRVPRCLYGAAGKEDEPQRLPERALRQGSRGIDPATQRRHYHEAAVGRAVAAAVAGGLVARDE